MSERDDLREQAFYTPKFCPELRCLKPDGHSGKHTADETKETP